MSDSLPALRADLRDAPLVSSVRTPYAVICPVDGVVYMTRVGFAAQMLRLNTSWMCPKCGGGARWDAANYDKMSQADLVLAKKLDNKLPIEKHVFQTLSLAAKAGSEATDAFLQMLGSALVLRFNARGAQDDGEPDEVKVQAEEA